MEQRLPEHLSHGSDSLSFLRFEKKFDIVVTDDGFVPAEAFKAIGRE